MSLFILTDANVVAAKAFLRTSLPHIRSAHLTEALAAGLGYWTHAALLDAISREVGKPPAVTESDGDRFIQRLSELGYKREGAAAFTTALAEPVLDDTPFTLFKQGDRFANDRHYHACERRNRPMMMVKMARQYAELEWDCITINPRQEGHIHGTDNGSALMRTMFTQFQAHTKGAPGKPFFDGSAFTGTIVKLLPATARQLAEDYFKLLYLPLREVHVADPFDRHALARK